MGLFLRAVRRCREQQARCAAAIGTAEDYPGGARLGASDWLMEEILMIREEFNALVAGRLASSADILTGKGIEYQPDGTDFLGNFKMQAGNWGVSPLVVWGIFLGKHIAAINTYVRTGKESASEPIEGRIDDAINYLLLGAGLIADMRVVEAEKPKRGRPVGSKTKAGRVIAEDADTVTIGFKENPKVDTLSNPPIATLDEAPMSAERQQRIALERAFVKRELEGSRYGDGDVDRT